MVNHNRSTDIIDLVCFNKEVNFLEGLKFICEIIGIDYYYDFDENLPDSIGIIQLIMDMKTDMEGNEENEIPLKPIPNEILGYYKPYVNDLFLNDNISYETQIDFGIGYDDTTNRITIPIYSETGDLVGVKGRLFKEALDEFDIKYIYLEPCAKSQILFGLNKTIDYISESGFVIVVESEKAVMQLWTYGYMNAVATGGKTISKIQIDMLIRLGVDIIFAFDQDVELSELEELSSRFLDNIPIYALIDDEKNILSSKESPTDNPDNFEQLFRNNKYKLR